MHHLRRAGFVTALAVTFVLGGFILPDRTNLAGPALFRDVLTLVSTRYIDSLEITEIYQRAAEGLVAELGDPYAELYSPDELEEFTSTYEGHYAGVGMMIEQREGSPVVARVFPNTPAERNGVRMGDRVMAIDGEAVDGWPLDRVANGLKGSPGSVVEVEFRRYGVSTPLATRMTRAVVRIPAVPFAILLEGDVGYVPLLQFNETAASEVAAAVEELMAGGAGSLILDLRGNAGGMLDQAIRVAGMFLPHGTPVARQWERAGDEIRYVNEDEPLAPELPLVVLVDGASASASEIVAGALQDHDRAVVTGTTTFGKGLVQTAYRLDGDYVFKLTTGKWYTPSGRSIHRERTLVRGRLVEVEDSVHFAADRDGRPAHRSASGRIVYGGGGITPDVEAGPSPRDPAQEALERALLPNSPEFFTTVYDYAVELKDDLDRDFIVAQEWRDEIFRRLADGGVELDREVYDRGAALIDDVLADRLARLAFGDAQAMLRSFHQDAPLMAALEVIREGGPAQAGLFRYVEEASAGR